MNIFVSLLSHIYMACGTILFFDISHVLTCTWEHLFTVNKALFAGGAVT